MFLTRSLKFCRPLLGNVEVCNCRCMFMEHHNVEKKCEQENVLEENERSTVSIGTKSWKKWWYGSFGKHPGKCNMSPIILPQRFTEAAKVFLQDYNSTITSTVAEKLNNFLLSRRTCREKSIAVLTPSNTKLDPNKVFKRTECFDDSNSSELFLDALSEEVKSKKTPSTTYQWKQVVYDKYNSAAYLLGRSPASYAVTLRVMNEIKQRVNDFEPVSIMDFGSGTGTSVWAANNLWEDSLKQYLCIDSSRQMNDLAFYIFAGGDFDQILPGLFIRQFLPVSFQNSYDLVISAHSLSELPSEKERLTLLKLLWEKTERFLILIEYGSFYGYYIMMEARNLLLKGIEGANPKSSKRWSKFSNPATIFSPCPHTYECPMWGTKSSCIFSQKFVIPEYAKEFHRKLIKNENFTYIVFEKENNFATKVNLKWPRVIANPQQSNCVHCHLCSPTGLIEHVSVSKSKYGTDFYQVSKKSKLGDLLPFIPPSNAEK